MKTCPVLISAFYLVCVQTSGAVLCSVDISAKPLQSREQHTPRYLLGKEVCIRQLIAGGFEYGLQFDHVTIAV